MSNEQLRKKVVKLLKDIKAEIGFDIRSDPLREYTEKEKQEIKNKILSGEIPVEMHILESNKEISKFIGRPTNAIAGFSIDSAFYEIFNDYGDYEGLSFHHKYPLLLGLTKLGCSIESYDASIKEVVCETLDPNEIKKNIEELTEIYKKESERRSKRLKTMI